MTTTTRTPDAARLRRLQALAHVLDDSIPIPVINRRIGVDSVIGMVPLVGDLAGGAISLFVLYNAWRLGASFPTLLRMLGNVAFEMIVGAVPVLGDLFDMGFKANLRNVRLLEERAADTDGVERESALYTLGFFGVVALLVCGAVGVTIYVAVSAVRALIGLF